MNKKLIVPGADRNQLPPGNKPASKQLPVKKSAPKK